MYKKSSFRPNQTGWLKRQISHDVKGRPTFSDEEVIRLSVIRLETGAGLTSIRADSSGSKSRAEENSQIGRILLHPEVIFAIGDLIRINDAVWKVDSNFPRFDQAGRLHHYQVDLVAWV